MILSRKASPSGRQLRSIQRLEIYHLHSSSSSSVHSSTSVLQLVADRPKRAVCRGSLSKWIAGIAAGSSLGLLYWSSTPDSSSGVIGCKSVLSFTDWSTEPVELSVDDHHRSRSLLTKFALPDDGSKFIFGDAYRRKIFFNYEKRIRLNSPPEKVFEYFASVRTPEGELFMNPADLMRAIVPVFPPSESHLVRDGYLMGERNPGELRCDPSEFFMLFDMDTDGRISFKEYIFFVTLLSIPESCFSVAFKMFDIDNSGEIDKDEFKKVMTLMRSQHRQGVFHRNGLRTGFKVNDSVENGGLVEYFFGKDGNHHLQHDRFMQFMRGLADEMLRLEFDHYDFKGRGSISAKDFGLSMVASAEMSHLDKLLDRIEELNNEPHLHGIRISLEEFKQFAELRRKLQPLSLALFSYGTVNGLLTQKDFQRAASNVCGVSLSDNVVAITFYVFDTNQDGNLSIHEFLRALHKRERDIAQPVSSGLRGFLSSCFNRSNSCSIGQSQKTSMNPSNISG